jgi:DNA-directed RNA polymerase specialized sigma24 family protein
MTASTLEVPFRQLTTDQATSREQEQLAQFTNWFSRCRTTLHFIASRILGGSEMAERAIENCRIRASRNMQNFRSEGSFRSWIMRILINEALSILHRSDPKIFEANVPNLAGR